MDKNLYLKTRKNDYKRYRNLHLLIFM